MADSIPEFIFARLLSRNLLFDDVKVRPDVAFLLGRLLRLYLLLHAEYAILDYLLGLLPDLVRQLNGHAKRLGLGRSLYYLLRYWYELIFFFQVRAARLRVFYLLVLR